MRLLQGDDRRDPAAHREPAVPPTMQRVSASRPGFRRRHQRDKEFRPQPRVHAVETARRNSHDGKRMTVQLDRASHDVAIRREAPLPEPVAQNDDRMSTRCPVLFRKKAAA